MEKLELKHLTGYLPYKLKCICESTNHKEDNFTFVLDEISTINGIFASYEWYSLSGGCIKPVLRNLSDLTKRIEVNGEKFIPMHKLLEYSETNYFNEDDDIKIKFNTQILSCEWNTYKYSKEKDAIIKYIEKTGDGALIYSLTYSSLLRRFVFRNETYKRPLGVGYQLDLFQKLYEWHFDLHGLIEKGLAIDINTL